LRNCKKDTKRDVLISITAADPLNLTGVITPGRRVPAFSGNRILYQDGVPIAFKEAKKIEFIGEPEQNRKWVLHHALIQHTVSPKLRKYLGKAV
jgi:ATP-dependent Lhr-like helicase